MNIEQGKISGSQLTFALASLIFGSIFAGAFISNLTTHDSWLVILCGFLATILLAILYASVSRKFPSMNLVQINSRIYGKYIGTAISILYAFYFLMVLSFNIRQVGDFYLTFFTPETPLDFYLVIFSLICAFAVWKGVEVLTRLARLFTVILLFIIISTFALLIPIMDFSNFLPLFEFSIPKFLHALHIITVIPFGEIFIFFSFAAALNNNAISHLTKNILIGLTIGAIGFLIITIRDIAVLGNTYSIYSYPALNSARLIDVGNILTKMDFLIGIGFTVSLLFKTSLFYYATVSLISELLKLKIYFPLILPIGGIAVILADTDWQSSVEYATVSPNVAPSFITPFILIFPILSFIIAKIRKIPKNTVEDEK